MSAPDATDRKPANLGRPIGADVETEGVWIRAGTVSLEGELVRQIEGP